LITINYDPIQRSKPQDGATEKTWKEGVKKELKASLQQKSLEESKQCIA
jgi:hypothetical protein